MTDQPRPAVICPICMNAVCPPGARRCTDCQTAFDARTGKPPKL
jgi:hypothetical protein